MRTTVRLACCAILLAIHAGTLTGQAPRPGTFLATDESGAVWEIDRIGNAFPFTTLIAPTWGVTFDPAGDAIVAGRGALWRIDAQRQVTTIVAGLHVSPIGDVEIDSAGNYLLTAFGNNLVTAVNRRGQPIGAVQLAGANRAWGMGIDPVSGELLVASDAGIYRIDAGFTAATLIRAAWPAAFLQGGAIGANGRFVFADETTRAVFEIDTLGNVTTLTTAGAFVDVGEGVTVDELGRTWVTDDGAIVGPTQNRLFAIGVGGLGLTTVTITSQVSDVNGLAVVPTLRAAATAPTVRVGMTATIAVTAAGAPNAPFVFASALGATTGFPLPGARRFPLDPDGLFAATAADALPTVFVGFRGRLTLGGSAGLQIRVPSVAAFAGITIHTAGITLDPRAPGGIHLVSNSAPVAIVP